MPDTSALSSRSKHLYNTKVDNFLKKMNICLENLMSTYHMFVEDKPYARLWMKEYASSHKELLLDTIKDQNCDIEKVLFYINSTLQNFIEEHMPLLCDITEDISFHNFVFSSPILCIKVLLEKRNIDDTEKFLFDLYKENKIVYDWLNQIQIISPSELIPESHMKLTGETHNFTENGNP